MIFFLIGYIWVGSIVLTVLLVKVFIPEDSFSFDSIKENRVMMFRRYVIAVLAPYIVGQKNSIQIESMFT